MHNTQPKHQPTKEIRMLDLIFPALLQGLAWPFGRTALNFFTRLHIHGKENLAQARQEQRDLVRGTIFAVNHTHELDFSFPLVAIPPFSPFFPMFYVAHGRKQYSKNTGLGWRRLIYGLPIFLTSWGAHPYVAGQRDYAKAMPYHEKLLRAGKSICIFPEGNIQKYPEERKIHGGVSYLCEVTNARIIPIAVSGVRNMSFLDFLLRRRTLHISYGKPLSSKEIINDSLPIPERYQAAAKTIMQSIDSQRAMHVNGEPSSTS